MGHAPIKARKSPVSVAIESRFIVKCIVGHKSFLTTLVVIYS